MSVLYIGLFLIILYMIFYKNYYHLNKCECMGVDKIIVFNQPWNMTSRHTRNMSYDIRGDVENPYFETGPWNNSSLI
jgi:hypothetical protein